jgi:hypothetical protein
VPRLAISRKSFVERAPLAKGLDPRNYLIPHGLHDATLPSCLEKEGYFF